MTTGTGQTDDETFIQQWASLLIPTGMPPIAARINAHLLLSKEPIGLDDLVERLGVSKSSASVAARVLERYGIARRVTEAGTKRVRYEISGRCDGFLAEQIQLFESLARLLKSRSAHGDPETRARFRDLSDFYLQLRDAMAGVYSASDGRS